MTAGPHDCCVVDPHVRTDRSIDFSTVDRLLASLVRPEMTAEEQERFWLALQAPASPTEAQRELGEIMRGDG